MIVKPPAKFSFNDNTSNLFLFYQLIMDMTFNYSPDSYKVSVHNTHSLIIEAYNIYLFLKRESCIEKYYTQYLPKILDELISSLQADDIAHEILGHRYDEYKRILVESKSSSMIFESNIGNLLALFSKNIYYKLLCAKISSIIHSTSDGIKLLQLTNDWLCELVTLDYSLQHVYAVTNHFFTKKIIQSPNDFESYLSHFDFKKTEWELLYFCDAKLAEYHSNFLYEIISWETVKEFQIVSDDILSVLVSDKPKIRWVKDYYSTQNKLADRKIAVIKARVIDYDPYKATVKLKSFIRTIGDIVSIFDNEKRVRFSKVGCLNYKYNCTLIQVNPMDKRTRDISRDDLGNTTKVLKQLNMSENMLTKFILKAFSFHNDALFQDSDSKYLILMLWTALESLFSDTPLRGNKYALVKDFLLEIIHRTYIIKAFKYLQADVIKNLKNKDPDSIDKYNIRDIKTFIEIMFDKPTTDRVMAISNTLNDNPLLRLRIFVLIDKKLKKGSTIKKMLEDHRQKIEWQIERIYRSRNFLVHSGNEFPFSNSLVENLHNYFDFIVNYVLLKGSSNEKVISIESLISEAKLDNAAHMRILQKHKETKTNENINELLFGPSTNVLTYYRDSTI